MCNVLGDCGMQLKIEMISMHVDDDGSTENIHNLSEAELAIRKVDYVEIASDEVGILSHELVARTSRAEK